MRLFIVSLITLSALPIFTVNAGKKNQSAKCASAVVAVPKADLNAKISGMSLVEDQDNTNGTISFNPALKLSEKKIESFLKPTGLIFWGVKDNARHLVLASGSLESFQKAAQLEQVRNIIVGISNKRFERALFGSL
ncbi:MAG: hypothetical protein JWQ35_508 [Bacteriovoracaceae bacterium]|nr:hypothetical protein [Bacteriovoracaceae bacterium]